MIAVGNRKAVRTVLAGAVLLVTMSFASPSYSANHSISYNLANPGRVSLNVYGSAGRIVRELLHAQQQSAGNHVVTWDGMDRRGAVVSNPTSCTWKLLQTPSGLHAKRITNLATFPHGPETGTAWVWRTTVGNHTGLMSVAVDSSNDIYAGAGCGEAACVLIKMSSSGTCINSGNQPEVSMGRFAMCIMSRRLYHLEQDDYVGATRSASSRWMATRALW